MGTSSLILVLVIALSSLTGATDHCLTEERYQENQEILKEELLQLAKHQEQSEELLHSLTESVNLLSTRISLNCNDMLAEAPSTIAPTEMDLRCESKMMTSVTEMGLKEESQLICDITERELKAFYAAAYDGDIDYINDRIKEGKSSSWSSSRLNRILAWQNVDEHEQTALHVATDEDHIPVVVALLEAGATPSLMAVYSDTPVHYAAGKGHIAVLRALLQPQYQANVNTQNDGGKTPVYGAARMGRTEALEVLLAHGADVNIADSTGTTPLMTASWRGHVDITQALITAGARMGDADNWGGTALHYAASSNRQDVVKLLLQNGIDKRHQDKYGNTAADRARENGYGEVADIIDNWQ